MNREALNTEVIDELVQLVNDKAELLLSSSALSFYGLISVECSSFLFFSSPINLYPLFQHI